MGAVATWRISGSLEKGEFNPAKAPTALGVGGAQTAAPMESPLSDAVVAGADAEALESLPLPDTFPAATVRARDINMFAGVEDKDVRKSLSVEDVSMPELAPDEALIAVMASTTNYNTVW